MRLGKREAVSDPRTLMLGNFIEPRVVPSKHDFDQGRAGFPLDPWGNDQWGNCVKVGEANQLVRLERLEQRRTLKLTADHVVKAYAEESERQFGVRPSAPGDAGDQGLVVLWNLRNWRNLGWTLDFTKRKGDDRTYTISAFGELVPNDYEQLKAACYLLHGVQLGLWLPRAVAGNYTYWDYNGETGDHWRPGSWGGHLVYAKAYNGDSMEILTWGFKVKVSKRFLARFCDEAYAVVDSWDNWRKSKEINVEGMKTYLREIGARGIE